MDKFFSILFLAVCYVNAVPFSNSDSQIVPRISNGVQAQDNQFPYAISIQNLDNNAQLQDTRGHRCGGALITLQHVLTTATCLSTVAANGSLTWVNAASLQVFAGAALLTNSTADRVRPIANYTVHPNYIQGPAFLNDIAIVTLSAPFPDTTVTPLALPPATFDPVDFELCTVAGWGATQNTVNAQMSTVLRFANKYLYNQNLCTSVYSTLPAVSNVFPSMVCAASFDIISTGCAGDSGNALVCNNTLTGILFHHNDCNPTSFPELYTRVSNYTTWIRSITGSASSFTPGLFMLILLTVSQFVFAKVVS